MSLRTIPFHALTYELPEVQQILQEYVLVVMKMLE